MKTFVFSAVAMAVLASCTNSAIDDVVNNDEPVAIRLSAGVQANVVVSRAPITSIESFKPIILGWEGATAEYNQNPKWKASTTQPIAGNASNFEITMDPLEYYNANASVNTFMKAFYVSGDIAPAMDSSKEYIYTFKNDNGDRDVLFATAISGNKSTNTTKAFEFKHLLTQIKFAVKEGAGLSENTTLRSITLKNVKVPEGFDLSTDALTYVDKAALLISDISSPTINGNTTTPLVVGSPVMISPMADLKLTVVTSVGTFDDVSVNIDSDASLMAGKAYTIALTFQQKAIAGKATVSDWEEGTGSGTVE